MEFPEQHASYRYRPWPSTHNIDEYGRVDHNALPASQVPAGLVLRSHNMSRTPHLAVFGHSKYQSMEPEDDYTMHPFPGIVATGPKHLENDGAIFPQSYRVPSPCNSSLSSSYTSSTWSDRQQSPWPSPDMSIAYSPGAMMCDAVPNTFGGSGGFAQGRCASDNPCVAMHDVQAYADMQPERQVFDHEPTYGYSLIEEGYQTVQGVCTPDYETVPTAPVEPLEKHIATEQPVIRHRRVQSHRSITSPQLSSKVTKRASASKRQSVSHGRKPSDTNAAPVQSPGDRSFICPLAPYGCSSTFGSKNEWKRHVNTQHLRVGFWRCDQCSSHERKPNDFNRKDLFVQHVRRMHPIDCPQGLTDGKNSRTKAGRSDEVDEALNKASQRCFKRLRSPPTNSCCVFCDASFSGEGSWDERMEHVGRHMENMKKSGDHAQSSSWRRDDGFEAYLSREGLTIRHGRTWILADRQP